MKASLTQLGPAAVVLVAIGFRHASNWCIDVIATCYGTWVHQNALSFTKPLYFFALYLLPLTIFLIFIRREIFNSWLKLAAWAFPLSILFIANVEVSSMAFFEYVPFYRDDAARFAAIVLTVASLVLIRWKYSRSRSPNLGTS